MNDSTRIMFWIYLLIATGVGMGGGMCYQRFVVERVAPREYAYERSVPVEMPRVEPSPTPKPKWKIRSI